MGLASELEYEDAAADSTSAALLIQACIQGDLTAAKLCIQDGAFIDTADKRGWQALHHAALRGHTDLVLYLLKAGAAPSAQTTDDGETPLSLAALARRKDVCKALLSAGAAIDSVADPTDRAYLFSVRSASPEHKAAPAAPPQPSARTPRSPSVRSVHSSGTRSRSRDPAKQQRRKSAHSVSTRAGAITQTMWSPRDTESSSSPSHTTRKQYSTREQETGLYTSLQAGDTVKVDEAHHTTQPDSPAREPIKVSRHTAQQQRPAAVMYVPCSSASKRSKASTTHDKRRWELQELMVPGMEAIRLLLDPHTNLVYWFPPQAALSTDTQPRQTVTTRDQRSTDSPQASPRQAATGKNHDKTQSSVPMLLGKLQGASVQPISPADAVTVESCPNALRCLRRHNAAAQMLIQGARESVALRADLQPDVAAAAVRSCVALAVPLCSVLGVCHPSELAQLHRRDLLMCGVDESYLDSLTALGRGLVGTRVGLTPGGPDMPLSSGTVGVGWGQGSVTLDRLLVRHGLTKLLPLAASLGLLSRKSRSKWHEVCLTARDTVALSNVELQRLRSLHAEITVLQREELTAKLTRRLKLTRVGVGNLVLYESQSHRGKISGGALVGIVLSVREAVRGVTGGALIRVRDLLDDSQVELSPGQVSHVSVKEAQRYLRADLLPPHEPGVPVTPLTAAPGLMVQRIGSWDARPGLTGSQTAADSETDAELASAPIFGRLVGPVEGASARWVVLWPDGTESEHNIGLDGDFALAHLHTHRLQGAPLLTSHITEDKVFPVVRGALWPFTTTDDVIPGSLGLARGLSGGATVQCMWSRARGRDPVKEYSLCEGTNHYPLCHGLLDRQPVTALTAKPSVLVDINPEWRGGVLRELQGLGPGRLTRPVSLEHTSMVWEVVWPGGMVKQLPLGAPSEESPLLVSREAMLLSGVGAVPLNEIRHKAHVGGPLGEAVIKTVSDAAAATLTRWWDTQQAVKFDGQLGRGLFLRPMPLAPRDGMLGVFVKLNRDADLMQMYCGDELLSAHVPRTPTEALTIQREGGPRAPLDDVGWVVRDAGAGQWRGLLVRRLGSTAAAWYDEAALLPISQQDLRRQVARHGLEDAFPYLLAMDEPGVVVTDANAAPGMLVKRLYKRVPGQETVQEGSDRAGLIGELVERVREHEWLVLWPDGTREVYKCGVRGRFQLCHVNLHDDAGAPLLARTVSDMAAAGLDSMPVTDGVHCCTASQYGPGQVRHLLTVTRTDSIEQPEPAEESSTYEEQTDEPGDRVGQRFIAEGVIHDQSLDLGFLGGGPLRLYELSHAICQRDPVTIFNAKPNLRVQRAADLDSATPKVGVLLRPVKLGLKARLEQKDETGEPIEWLKSDEVWWDVLWEDGHQSEMPVGTQADHTPLRVAIGGGIRNPDSIKRSLQALDGQIKQVAKFCQSLMSGYGSLRVQDRLLAVIGQVQLQSTESAYYEALEEAMSFNEDSDDDDDNEIQSYEYVKYLQQIEKHRQSLLGLQLARQGVLSAHQTLSAIGPTCWSHDSPADGHDKLREMAEWSEDACNMISSRLPSVIKKVVAASVAVSAKSCAKLLAYEGSVDKLTRHIPQPEEADEDDEVVRACTHKVSETAIALKICYDKLSEIEAMIPSDTYYADTITDMAIQAKGQVALACAAVASEWAASACVPILRLLNTASGDGSDELVTHSELLMLAMEQLVAAVTMNVQMRGRAEAESSISVSTQDLIPADPPQQPAQQADPAQQSAEPAAVPQQPADAPAPDQPSALQDGSSGPVAAEAVPEQPEAPVRTTVTVPEVERALQASVVQLVTLLHRASDASIQASRGIPSTGELSESDALAGLQRALSLQRIIDLLSDHAQTLTQMQQDTIPVRDERDKSAAKLQLMTRAAEMSRSALQRLAETVASRQRGNEAVCASVDSALCDALCNLTASEASCSLAGQWATRAAGHWPKLLQSYDKVADQIAQGVSSALDKADKEITEIQTALTGGGKGEAAAMRDLQEQLADVMEARKETEAKAKRCEQARKRWLASKAYACCYAAASDWAYKGLDDINTVYDLTASDACQYFALVEARARAQAPAGAAEERRALYPGDKTMLALHALEEPLRLSSPLVTTAMKHSERHKLEEAYHDIFKAAANVVYERCDRFRSEIEDLEERLRDRLSRGEDDQQSQGEESDSDSDSPQKPARVNNTAEAIVAQAYGLVYVAKDTLDEATYLLSLVPQILPDKQQVQDKLKEGRTDIPKLLARVDQMKHELAQARGPSAYTAYTDSVTHSILAAEKRRQQGTVSAATAAAAAASGDTSAGPGELISVTMDVRFDGESNTLAIEPVLAAVPPKARTYVKEAMASDAVSGLLEPLTEAAKQIRELEALLHSTTGTRWSPATLRYRQIVNELVEGYRDHLGTAGARLPTLAVW